MGNAPRSVRRISARQRGREVPGSGACKRAEKGRDVLQKNLGGGVTLSGGEVMAMDMDYIEALVKKLYRFGITVTIDTCGYAPRVELPEDSSIYRYIFIRRQGDGSGKTSKYIGADNTLILENLEKLSADGARIYIRIPTVKEVNGTDEDMRQIIDYLLEKKIRVAQIDLLPYHNTGSSKYERLGEQYEGNGLTAPSREEMEHFVGLFEKAGFHNTKIGG